MKKTLSSLVVILLGLTGATTLSIAEENNVDKQDILATCTAESKGAIDVQDYIDQCVKDAEDEMKEIAKEVENTKPKS